MPPRAEHLIALLDLQPHPEGGWFRETFRSAQTVQPQNEPTARPIRAALTTIYFLLAAGQVSRWHRVLSDEVWHFYEGDPLELRWRDAESGQAVTVLLGPVPIPTQNLPGSEAEDNNMESANSPRPVHVVPAGCWQTARSIGAYTLVGCTVGPGFDFADFEMASNDPA